MFTYLVQLCNNYYKLKYRLFFEQMADVVITYSCRISYNKELVLTIFNYFILIMRCFEIKYTGVLAHDK